MRDQIVIQYQDINITYIEKKNEWNFTLRGRERNAPSLEKAKEWIDKPEPETKKTFRRQSAYYVGHSRDFEKVEVTSVADSPSYIINTEMWIVDGKGNRSKVSSGVLFAVTEKNNSSISEVRSLDRKMASLRNHRDEIMKSMDKLEIPK